MYWMRSTLTTISSFKWYLTNNNSKIFLSGLLSETCSDQTQDNKRQMARCVFTSGQRRPQIYIKRNVDYKFVLWWVRNLNTKSTSVVWLILQVLLSLCFSGKTKELGALKLLMADATWSRRDAACLSNSFSSAACLLKKHIFRKSTNCFIILSC